MISGFEAYRIYLALKLHFEKDDYDVFIRNGAVNIREATFEKRNDKLLHVKFGKRFSEKKHLAQCVVANIAYGNTQPVYDIEKALYNYILWRKKKDSISKIFEEDLQKLKSLDAVTIYTAPINIETKVILNIITPYIDNIPKNALTDGKIRLIKKLKRFVKFDEERIRKILNSKLQSN